MDIDLAEAPGQLGAAATMIWAWGLAFLPRFGAALLLLIVGLILAGWASRLVRRLLTRTRHVDDTVIPVIGTAIRYAILIVVLVAFLGQLGIQTTSLLAVLGAAGLAIGLALQGTLSNIAAGLMLLYLRPFRVGDYIETATVSGAVKEIGLFATCLESSEGIFVFAPNSEIWNKPLRNQSRNPRRMISLQISASYDADPAEVRRVLLEMAASESRLLTPPEPQVYVDSYREDRVVYSFRAWAPTFYFAEVQRALMEAMKQRLQEAGIKIPM